MDGLNDEPGDYLTDRITDEALDFVENHRDRPFFFYLSHFAVHDPIQGREDLVDKYQQKLNRLPNSEVPPFVLEGNPDDTDPLSRTERATLVKENPYRGHRVLPNRMIKVKQRQDNVEFAAMVETVARLKQMLHDWRSDVAQTDLTGWSKSVRVRRDRVRQRFPESRKVTGGWLRAGLASGGPSFGRDLYRRSRGRLPSCIPARRGCSRSRRRAIRGCGGRRRGFSTASPTVLPSPGLWSRSSGLRG